MIDGSHVVKGLDGGECWFSMQNPSITLIPSTFRMVTYNKL